MPNEIIEPKRGLVAKLCEVMAEAGYVQKRGHNEKFNYDYATEADVVDSLRDKLAARKVFVFPSVISSERREHSKTSSGGTMFITDVLIKWTFLDGETGETQECVMPGCGTDTGDKGIYKAITGSSKYLFLKAFMLPTGDDPEDEKVDRAEGVAAAKAVATEKLRAAAKGDENITLTPYKQGWTAISGNGLPIIRAALTTEELTKLGLRAEGNVWMVPVSQSFIFADTCSRHNVGTVFMDAPKPNDPPVVETPVFNAETLPKPEKKIDSVKEKSGKTKNGKDWEMLEVVYGGERFICWDKKLWPLLTVNKGRRAVLSTIPSFDGKKDGTVDGIISIGTTEYEERDGKIVVKSRAVGA